MRSSVPSCNGVFSEPFDLNDYGSSVPQPSERGYLSARLLRNADLGNSQLVPQTDGIPFEAGDYHTMLPTGRILFEAGSCQIMPQTVGIPLEAGNYQTVLPTGGRPFDAGYSQILQEILIGREPCMDSIFSSRDSGYGSKDPSPRAPPVPKIAGRQEWGQVTQSATEKASTPPTSSRDHAPNNCASESFAGESMADAIDQCARVEKLQLTERKDSRSSSPVQSVKENEKRRIPSETCSSDDVCSSSSQSDNTYSSEPASPQGYQLLVMARARHEVVASVMKEVYAMLGFTEDAVIKQCAQPGHENSTNDSIEVRSRAQGKRRNGKRLKQIDNSSANEEDDDQQKKRPKHSLSKPTSGDTQLLLACPFHKYDPLKYRPTANAGSRYRTCVGPGFKSISRLK